MVAYNFQRRFVEPILEGRKRQTIRAVGKRRHARPGETLQIYTGLRTQHCRLVASVKCESVSTILMNFDAPAVFVGDEAIGIRFDLDVFARADGFKDWTDLVDFWAFEHFKGRPPTTWEGVIVKW